MKVVLLSSGSGSRGGGEIYLRFLAQGLAAQGCDVHALIPSAQRMDELADSMQPYAAVRRLSTAATYERPLRNFAAIADRRHQALIARSVAELAPDVVHVNQQVAEDGLDLLLGAVASGYPTISTIHITHAAASLGARFGWLRDQLTIATLRRAAASFITVSRACKAQLSARIGGVTAAQSIHVIHNGVPSHSGAELASARAKARADWGASEKEIIIGCVGRIEQQKNPLLLVKLARELNRAGILARAVWIGDGTLRDRLVEHSVAARLVPQLVIDGWRGDAATRVAGLDIYLLPSRFEGLSLAMLEAMHAGLPVIAAHSDGTPEAVRHNENGLLCTNLDEWRSAVIACASDATLRHRLGSAAQRAAHCQFSIQSMACATLQIYCAAAMSVKA